MFFVTRDSLVEYLNRWLKTPNSLFKIPLVPFIHGEAGIGKTQIIKNLAKQNGYNVFILNLAHQEEGDLIGIPKSVEISENNYATVWTEPEWLFKNKNKKTLLFLDEIDRAPKNILNVMLTLIREYRIHTHKIPDKWKIIAAGNSWVDEDLYDTTEMDFALITRFVHFYYKLNPKEWLEWAKKNNIEDIVIKYLRAKPNHLLLKPKSMDTASPYPTPRGWEYLSENLKIVKNSEIVKYVATGILGDEIGMDFYVFYKTHFNLEYMTFEEIINNPKDFEGKNKNFYTNTVLNISDQLDGIIENYEKKEISKILTKIIVYLGLKGYLELAYMLINAIESKNQEIAKEISKLAASNQKAKSVFEKIRKEIK